MIPSIGWSLTRITTKTAKEGELIKNPSGRMSIGLLIPGKGRYNRVGVGRIGAGATTCWSRPSRRQRSICIVYFRASGNWVRRPARCSTPPVRSSLSGRCCTSVMSSCCREVRAWVGYGRLVEFLIWVISARVPFRPGGPFPRHLEEMPLQSMAMNVAHQLHTVCCQAHALKRMLSQVVRLGHSSPP